MQGGESDSRRQIRADMKASAEKFERDMDLAAASDHERRIAHLERIVALLCEQVAALMDDEPPAEDMAGNPIPVRDVSQSTL